jgi:hypothetical protein
MAEAALIPPRWHRRAAVEAAVGGRTAAVVAAVAVRGEPDDPAADQHAQHARGGELGGPVPDDPAGGVPSAGRSGAGRGRRKGARRPGHRLGDVVGASLRGVLPWLRLFGRRLLRRGLLGCWLFGGGVLGGGVLGRRPLLGPLVARFGHS